MSCPDLEALGAALDLDPEDAEHLAAVRHLRSCQDCAARAELLGEVEAALSAGVTWGAPEPAACLSEEEMLRALSGEPGAREVHLAACEVCRAELKALRDEERVELSPDLKARLRGLAAGASTTEELRLVSGRRRQSSRGASGRRSSRRLRRASGVLRRASLRVPQRSVQQPTWAWGVLAAAAALLVALGLALQPDAPRRVADRGDVPDAGTTPLRVSDVQGRPGGTRATNDADVEPSYPLPPARSAEDGSDTWGPAPLSPAQPSAQVEPEGPARGPELGTTAPRARDGDPTSPRSGEPGDEPTPAVAEHVPDDGGRIELALTNLRGAVQLDREGERTKLARRGGALELQPGDRLTARTGGFVSLEGGAYELCLDQGTELVVAAAQGGPVLRLDHGRLLAEVATLPTGKRFAVRTAHAELSVLGTVFAVEASPEMSRLLVVEGTVKATTPHGEARVSAGMGVSLERGAAPGEQRRVRPEELGWSKAWAPRRQPLYAVRFDDQKLGGFQGELSEEQQPHGGRALVLEPLADSRYWGLWAHADKGRMPAFRAATDVYLQFSLWVEAPAQVLLQAYNDTQAKEFKRGLEHPGGYWRTYTVPLMELSTYYDPGKNPVREGDLFVDLEVYAGEPGERRVVLIDDVSIFRKVYR